MISDTKSLIDNQISKIFTIIEKSSDNPEICKIAIETLSYKCIETPVFIYPIISNLIQMVIKGNAKGIEDSSMLLESFFEDFNSKVLNKILMHDLYKNQFKEFIEDPNDILPSCLIININNQIKSFNEISYVDFSIFKTGFDVNKLECLYAKDKDSPIRDDEKAPFSQMEMNVLFMNDDETRKEVEKSLITSTNIVPINDSHGYDDSSSVKKNHKERLALMDYYLLKEKQYKMNSNDSNLPTSGIKKRKLDNNTQVIYEVKLCPFYSFIMEILKYNSMNYRQRTCSISLLKILHQFYNKILYGFYSVQLVYSSTTLTIENIIVDKTITYSDQITQIIQKNLISKLIVNSILDKVIDYTNDDYICLSKELNLNMASCLLIETQSLEINTEISCIMMGLLDQFFGIKKDWQPLFAVLTLFKYLFLSPNYVTDKGKLFHLLSKLMTTDSEDILNLTIQILDKMLEANLLSHFIEKEELSKVFSLFLKLINRYDDIESGVRYYFSCLYHFILFFLHDNTLEINSLVDLLNNDFTFHSMNKIINVRIKYFEVINNLLIGKKNSEAGFHFPSDFIEHNTLIAFQGLCIEEDKQLLKIQQTFIMNVLMYDDNYSNVFIKHCNNIFGLLLCEHVTNLNHFYIPSNERYDRKEIEEVYRCFFLNQMQTDLITQAYERKTFYVIPILSLILKIKVDFIQVIDLQLKINLNDAIVIREKVLILLKIYLYYLEFIESNSNKIFIINDEVLKKMSENTSLSEFSIKITRKNIENQIGIRFKHFLDFTVNKLGKVNPLVNALYTLYKKLNDEYTLNLKEMNETMKNVYDSIKQSGNNESLKQCCELVKYLKDSIETVEHSQNVTMLRQKIRGYSSACLFIHSIYSNVKYNKISSITNSFLNCLKMNNKESKVFVKYILKLILSLDNSETISKIIFTFIENSIKSYYEQCSSQSNDSPISSMNNNNNNNSNDGNAVKEDDKKAFSMANYIFLPIKYFFGEFAKYQKHNDIQKILSDYQGNLLNPSTSQNICMETRIIILLYLLSSIKHEVNCMSFITFRNILGNYIKFKHEANLVSLISIIVINCTKLFFDINNQNDLKTMLSLIYNSIDFTLKPLEFNIFIFRVIDKISCDNIISTSSIDFIFIILNYINHKNETIRNLGTSIFSKLMKIISMLKFETNYEDIAQSTSPGSLDFITKIFTQNIYDIKELKVSIKENLRNYQLIGINWLLFLGGFGLGLALCDDMGLGKTIQTLIAITHSTIEYKEKNGKIVYNLIVCPSTLVLNWVLESKKFFNEKDLVIIPIENSFYELKNSNHSKVTIFITSYEKVRDNLNNLFTKEEFFYLVLDEAHIIKNSKSKTYGSIRKLSAERRIILTGTPIQNNVMELWSLFDFLMPGFLGNENDFEIKYQKKIHSNIKKLNLEEKLQENIFQTSLTEIRKRIKPFVLRRLKSDVLQELPEKIILDYNCEMIPSQRDLYNKWIKKYEDLQNKECSLGIIDKLRKICNHPLLLEKDDSGNTVFTINPNPSIVSSSSGKFKSLEELLISLGFEGKTLQDPLSYENKLLIFTQYKHMCHLLKIFLEDRFSFLSVIELTSDTKIKDRGSIVMKFNSDPTINILLLTTSIGGLGINLTSANIVVMFDHNWNPTIDMQAIDRAHRIGQKKTVQVFRLITLDSIEEQLISLQTFKKYIANNVVDTSKISDKKVEAESIMESFEYFSNEKNNLKKQKKNIKKKSKLDEIGNEMEANAEKEELEIDYLKSLINKN